MHKMHCTCIPAARRQVHAARGDVQHFSSIMRAYRCVQKSWRSYFISSFFSALTKPAQRTGRRVAEWYFRFYHPLPEKFVKKNITRIWCSSKPTPSSKRALEVERHFCLDTFVLESPSLHSIELSRKKFVRTHSKESERTA